MGDVGRIVQQASAAERPRQQLATRTRELVGQRFLYATRELEKPLVERAKQIQEGQQAQKEQLQNLEKNLSVAKKESVEAQRLVVDAVSLQRIAEQMDKRVRVLEELRRILS